jgi:putative transposase
MAKVTPISECVPTIPGGDAREFLRDLIWQTKLAWQRFFELQWERQRDRFSGWGVMNGERASGVQLPQRLLPAGLVTCFGTIRLRIARTRGKSFLPGALQPFQRRAAEVAILIREAFLRGISTRQVEQVVATLTEETVSAQTVPKLTRDLDEAVRQFHAAPLADDYVYLFLEGRCGVASRGGWRRCWWRRDGIRPLPVFLRSQGDSQADWEVLLQDLQWRGLERKHLGLIVTDGRAGLAAAIPTVYPRVRHQRCWGHKMRNI